MEIQLPNGMVAVVDDCDAEKVKAHRWRAMVQKRTTYVVTNVPDNGRQRTLYLHRYLVDAERGQFVDHADGDGLNNSRENLRLCNRRQNGGNSKRHRKPKTSRFKGVYLLRGLWYAVVGHGADKHLGSFKAEDEAARAYDAAAVEHYGEFAKTNASMGLL